MYTLPAQPALSLFPEVNRTYLPKIGANETSLIPITPQSFNVSHVNTVLLLPSEELPGAK